MATPRPRVLTNVIYTSLLAEFADFVNNLLAKSKGDVMLVKEQAHQFRSSKSSGVLFGVPVEVHDVMPKFLETVVDRIVLIYNETGTMRGRLRRGTNTIKDNEHWSSPKGFTPISKNSPYQCSYRKRMDNTMSYRAYRTSATAGPGAMFVAHVSRTATESPEGPPRSGPACRVKRRREQDDASDSSYDDTTSKHWPKYRRLLPSEQDTNNELSQLVNWLQVTAAAVPATVRVPQLLDHECRPGGHASDVASDRASSGASARASSQDDAQTDVNLIDDWLNISQTVCEPPIVPATEHIKIETQRAPEPTHAVDALVRTSSMQAMHEANCKSAFTSFSTGDFSHFGSFAHCLH